MKMTKKITMIRARDNLIVHYYSPQIPERETFGLSTLNNLTDLIQMDNWITEADNGREGSCSRHVVCCPFLYNYTDMLTLKAKKIIR